MQFATNLVSLFLLFGHLQARVVERDVSQGRADFGGLGLGLSGIIQDPKPVNASDAYQAVRCARCIDNECVLVHPPLKHKACAAKCGTLKKLVDYTSINGTIHQIKYNPIKCFIYKDIN